MSLLICASLRLCYPFFVFFFFQAEDGIRDLIVTGVQTCALPISARTWPQPPARLAAPQPPAVPHRPCNSAHPPWLRPTSSLQHPSYRPHERPVTQIGRASCRERV